MNGQCFSYNNEGNNPVLTIIIIQLNMLNITFVKSARKPLFKYLDLQIKVFRLYRRMAENGFAPPTPPREFRRHILSCRELKAESFKTCLHSVLRGVSL